MESTRQKKYSKLIQREMGDLFQRDIKNLFGKAFITVTRVSMSPDLSVAKIYLSILMIEKAEEVMDGIESHKSEIRKMLGNKIGKQVRIVPELIFFLDKGAEHASHIHDLLSKLDIPPEDSKTPNQ